MNPQPAIASGLSRPEGPTQKVVLPGQSPAGNHVLSVLVKRTYGILPGRTCVRAETDRKLVSGDVHYSDPTNSSVRFESDFVPFKIGTDVVLNGAAHAPRGEKVGSLTASLLVGAHRKDLWIIGDRVCRYRAGAAPTFSEPVPFSRMEIRYERAYGGVDVYSEGSMACAYPRNPLGRGYAVRNTASAVDGLPLPNVEDPSLRIIPDRLCTGDFRAWEGQPVPQGFGWVSKESQPRCAYAGVMPAQRALESELRKAYAPLVPVAQRHAYAQTPLPDMDFRFFSGASPGLSLPFLAGDEEIRLQHLTAEGELVFRLSGDQPRVSLDLGLMAAQTPETVLHTVMIRPEDLQVDLVWRTAFFYPGPDWLPEMKRMDLFIA
jgi:hypothetical protein